MDGYLAEAISSSASFELATVMPMFDCPEQSQTSPTRTLSSVRVFFPQTVSE